MTDPKVREASSATFLGYRDKDGNEMHCAHSFCPHEKTRKCRSGCIAPVAALASNAEAGGVEAEEDIQFRVLQKLAITADRDVRFLLDQLTLHHLTKEQKYLAIRAFREQIIQVAASEAALAAIPEPGAGEAIRDDLCPGGINPGWDDCQKCGATSDDECRYAAQSPALDPVTVEAVCRRYLESALRWQEVFEDGRGGNDLNLHDTLNMMVERMLREVLAFVKAHGLHLLRGDINAIFPPSS